MRNYFLYLIFLFTSFTVHAQIVKGKVQFDDEYFNEQYLEHISILNARTHRTVYTDAAGNFTTEAALNDQLILTSNFISKRIVIIRERAFLPDFKIYVEPKLIQLDEVKLHNMNKNLEKNHLKTQEEMNQLYKSLGIDPQLRYIEPKKDVSKFKPSDLTNPLRLYGHLSGKNKEERTLRNFESKEKALTEVENLFPIEYYTIDLGLQEHQIKEFIRWVNSKQNLAVMLQNSTTEMIRETLFQRSFEYKRLVRANQRS